MTKTVTKVWGRTTRPELVAAMNEYNADMAAVLFFMAGAEAEGVMFQGRSAADAMRAVARLLNVPPEALDLVRGALA